MIIQEKQNKQNKNIFGKTLNNKTYKISINLKFFLFYLIIILKFIIIILILFKIFKIYIMIILFMLILIMQKKNINLSIEYKESNKNIH